MLMSGKLWIFFGALAGTFSLIAVPLGFHLLGKEKAQESSSGNLPAQIPTTAPSQKTTPHGIISKTKIGDNTKIQNNSVGGDLVVGTKNVINQLNPGYGNLKNRASSLSYNILNELHSQGWPDREKGIPGRIPNTPEEQEKWSRNIFSYFMWKYFDEVKTIRDEFFTLHIVDEQLDIEIKIIEAIRFENMQYTNQDGKPSGKGHHVPPQGIESIAFSLKKMNEQLN
jgi:hypothetical protein